MPRQTSGSYQQPNGTAAVSATTIGSVQYNSLITDLGSEITNSLDRLGRAAMLAALPMGGQKITGMANGTATTDGATMANVAALIPSGTVMLFAQASAPTGWTQITTVNDASIRIVSGTGGVANGSVGLSTFLANGALGHVLTTTEMPSHNHSASDSGHAHAIAMGGAQVNVPSTGATLAPTILGSGTSIGYANITIGYNGSNGAHTHALSALSYYDVIMASKN